MLETIEAIAFQKEIKLGCSGYEYPLTKPFLVTAKDGNTYICKLFSEEIGNLPVTNEYVCYLLGLHFQLPLEDAVLLKIDDSIISSTPELRERNIQSNIGFALKWNQKANANVRRPALEICKNTDIIPTLIYFDQFILNKDRVLNDGNLLFDSKEKKLIVIDHSHVFENGEVWNDALFQRVKDKWIIDEFDGKYYNMLLPYIKGNNPFNNALKHAQSLTDEIIQNIIFSIPDEWRVPSDLKFALINFLCYRNKNSNKIVEAIAPHCPYWKGGVSIL